MPIPSKLFVAVSVSVMTVAVCLLGIRAELKHSRSTLSAHTGAAQSAPVSAPL